MTGLYETENYVGCGIIENDIIYVIYTFIYNLMWSHIKLS